MIIRFFLLSLLLWSGALMALDPLDFYKIVRKVEVKGLSHVQASNLPMAALSTQPYKKMTQEGLSKDINVLYLTGYFNAVKVEVVPSDNQLAIYFVVQENPVIKKIQIKGSTRYTLSELAPKLLSKEGSVLNVKFLDQDKTTIETLYKDAGFSFFKVRDMSLTSQNVLTLSLSEGVIKNLAFTGLNNLQPFAVYRELEVKKGDAFNTNVLRSERDHLLKMGYFSEVSLPQIELNADMTEVRVTFNLVEKKINLVDVGFEQQDDQVVVFVQNIWNHTFIQHTDALITKFRVSNETEYPYQYNIRYTQPWLLNAYPVGFSADLWSENRQEFLSNDLDTLLSNHRKGSSLTFSFPLIRDRMTFSTKAKQEAVNPRDGASFTSYQIHSISFLLADKNIENPTNPKKGYYWSAEYEKGGTFAGLELGGLHFSRLTLQTAVFLGLSPESVLCFHPVAGLFQLQEQDVSTFETESYTLGGSTSLRGYKESSPFIGDRELALNVEYRQDFSTTFQGVLFCDVGRVFADDESFFSKADYHMGLGFGLRFMTPIGPIRTDFAWGETMMIIHFGIGQLF